MTEMAVHRASVVLLFCAGLSKATAPIHVGHTGSENLAGRPLRAEKWV